MNPTIARASAPLAEACDRAVKHHLTCAECADRDFLAITFDVAHLWKAA
jgi:hypothetical protein